jgi:integrase
MAQLSLGTDRKTGKRRTIRRRAPDRDSAERTLARLRREWGLAGDVAFVRLDEYLADWLDAMKPSLAPGTFTSYSGHVDVHIVPLLGHLTVGSLRPSDVHRLIRHLLDAGKAPGTVGLIVGTLRSALGEAVRTGELTVNVAQGVRLPRLDRAPVEAMTPERARLILDAVRYWVDDDGAVHGTQLEALYVLLLGTGMRAGEACALDWRDLDLDAGSVFIRRGKTRSATRTVPLAPFVVTALVAHRARAPRVGPSEPVFLGQRTSERLRVSVASQTFRKVLAAQGLPRMRLHELRHGCATVLLAKGVSMRVISEILGHADPALTARVYAHVGQESRERAAKMLEEAMG